ncbi:MAG: hypothetical protein IJ905_08370 [Fibrobacter sp.]|nr:hypothetical protein [Fibrobacter sp.]
MKKILTVIFLACAFVFAQEGSIKPGFQAFSGALIKLKKADKGFHKFMLKVDVAPWAFVAQGEVQAPGGDSDVLITALFDRALYAVLAYIPDKIAAGSDGDEYNVGFFDMMLYYDEEPTRIRNLSFRLLPPANDSWAQGILDDALQSGSLLGKIWGGKYEREITKASATPIDKAKLEAMQRERQEARAKAVADKRAREEAERQARYNSDKVKLKSTLEENSLDCNSRRLTAKQKRLCKMNRK